MVLAAQERLEIADLIALHGHVMDEGELDRLDELFSSDIVYDLEDFGFEQLRGVDAIRDAARSMGDRNPLAHHVTNVLVGDSTDVGVRVRSKGLAVHKDGSTGSVVYEDIVQGEAHGWRIVYRKGKARKTPLRSEGTFGTAS